MPVIDSFRDQYAFLSNFQDLGYPPILWVDGRPYDTVEHAYQAAKTVDPAEKARVRLAKGPGEAKRLGRHVTLRPDWDYIRLAVMHELLRTKFGFEPWKKQLLDTGEAVLMEGNNWGDAYWGVCQGAGENWLGRLLMLVRSEYWLGIR